MIYDFEVSTNSGEKTTLAAYRGKAMIIVNTASECGFTKQYDDLQKLFEKYHDRLNVLAFPCNQFGGQEPGSDAEISDFCSTRFHITFPLFSKVDVNGENAHPLFVYLKKELPGLLGTQKIKWNFTKFIVDAQGKPLERLAPQDGREKIEKALRRGGVV